MRLERVLTGRAVRLLRMRGREGGAIYGPVLVKACEERYNFLQNPRTLQDFDFAKGLDFQYGYFKNRTVIDKFTVYQDGMVVEAKTSTDECDAVLDDIISWIRNESGITAVEESDSARYYYSTLEVHADLSIAEQLEHINKVAFEITNILRGYHQITVDYELSGLLFSPGSGKPPLFRFERKENAPEEDRIYFSAAPLRTDDHLAVLKQLNDFLTM